MHFDHVGNIGLFPNATLSMARAELDFWTGRYSDRPCIRWAVASSEVRAVADLARRGRLYLVDQPSEELFPGIRLTRLVGRACEAAIQHRGPGADNPATWEPDCSARSCRVTHSAS